MSADTVWHFWQARWRAIPGKETQWRVCIRGGWKPSGTAEHPPDQEKDTVQIHLLDGTLTAAVTEIQAAEGVKMSDELEKRTGTGGTVCKDRFHT